MTGTSETQIVEQPLVSPADPKKVLAAMRRFEEFKREALTPKDYVLLVVNGEKKPYIKKSGWLKISLACQLSLEKRDEQLEETPNGGRVYRFTYRAVAPNGRFADACGSASTTERAFAHPEHDVRALAQTRAMNRAISNLVAGGELSAEEMVSETHEDAGTTPTPDSPVPASPSPVQPTEITVGMGRNQPKPSGTKSVAEIPIPASQSPAQNWKVPLSANQGTPEQVKQGLKQYPLIRGTLSYGMVNVQDDEISIIPERPLDIAAPPINWLIRGSSYRPGVIEPLCKKHGLQSQVIEQNGKLTAIILYAGTLEPKQIQELTQGAEWAFRSAMEPKEESK